MPRLPVFLAFLPLLWTAPALAEAPHVVASIKPVHSLVAGVMGEIGRPDLLVEGAASPHTYALKPSDAASLGRARLVFWVGPALEGFLVKPLEAQARQAKRVALMEAPGLVLHGLRDGGVWEGHDHAHDHAHPPSSTHRHESNSRVRRNTGRHDHSHGHAPAGERDAHVWLDPLNAIAMVKAIAAALGEVDPANAETYRRNELALIARLDELHVELRERLGLVQAAPFIVFHDAYQYFEKRYGLNAVGSITLSPERQPGARRVQEVRRKIADLRPRCVFSEPQFESAIVRTVIEGSSLRSGVLDPLGVELPAGPEAYPALMRGVAASLIACLAGTS
ncbi:MAG: zinc ABC transporter substrate-binding protein [Alphaproteobacteria bacterium]|nr:zinc ABC transporter substrate-binding protein [Alphaproteobacteria bacterium]